MRIILTGSGSFVARAIALAAESRRLDLAGLPHETALDDILRAGDCLINCALAPQYRSQPYDRAVDQDLKAAQAAARAGAHFLMLSTRRVYEPASRWNAKEGVGDNGDETTYGRNKARSELAIGEALLGKAGIFRLSNIIGYEYEHPLVRFTFMGLVLTNLRQKNKIIFDMHPATKRDFLPVEIAANMLLDRALDRTVGTYNLGSGLALACGSVAEWVLAGYGGGALETADQLRDEFFLNMDKWRSSFALPIDMAAMEGYCTALGRRLRCEKS